MKRESARELRKARGVAAFLAFLAGCGGGSSSGSDGGGSGPSRDTVLPDFALRSDLRIGPGRMSDALALDLNGDGLVDLLQGDYPLASLSIAFGNPDGSFTTAYTLATLGAPWRLAAGDVDGNGLIDVALTCLGSPGGAQSAGVQVFLQGPSAGDFGAAITKALPTRPLDVALAPVLGTAGPGAQELFVADREARAVLRFRYDGFQLVQQPSLDTGSLGVGEPISVACMDVGGDGWMDVVVGEVEVASGGHDRVVVFLRGPLGFGPPVAILSPVFAPIVEDVGDVDGNGYEDLGVVQLRSNHAYLLTGDGSGLYQLHAFDFEGTTTSIVFGDVDQDGLADAAATVLERDTVDVRLATGPLVWGEPRRYNVGFLPRAIGMAVLPGDELPDLLCASADDFSMLENRGNGLFRAAVGYPVDEGPVLAAAADLDLDGDPDVVVLNRRQRALSFLENDGQGRFELAARVPLAMSADGSHGRLVVADLNGDGLPDVATSVYQADQVWILRNTGTVADFTAPAPFDVLDVGPRPLGLGAGDLDGDGIVDLVVGLSGSGSVRCLRGLGNAELELAGSVPVGAAPAVLRTVDLDGNGVLDVVVLAGLDGAGARLIVLEGDGAGGLQPVFEAPLGAPGTSLDVADFDGDQLPDLVLGQGGLTGGDVVVALNRGGLQLELFPLSVGDGPRAVIAMDVDLDGNQDILVPTSRGELHWALGDGAGAFPTVAPVADELPVPHGTVASLGVDVNGDGLRDLVLVSPFSPLVWIARNTSRLLPTF